jgi:hypothetical protein
MTVDEGRLAAFQDELAALLEFQRVPNTEVGHAELASIMLNLANKHFPSPKLRCRVVVPEILTAADKRRAWPMELYWADDDEN